MNNTLFKNDVIMVNKLKYGPRLPQSPYEIPWVNVALYYSSKKKRMKEDWWSYKRLSGMTTIKQGDVLVFNLGLSKNFFVVKRCLGLSGDTLAIRNGEVSTNKKLFVSPQSVKNNYNFIVKDKKCLYNFLDSLSLNHIKLEYNKVDGSIRTSLSNAEMQQLQKLNCLRSLQKEIDTFNIEKAVFPNYPNTKWTLDDMGPIIIPKKGMEITFNTNTYLLYKSILKDYENCSLRKDKDNYFLNGEKVTKYKFKQSYYFVMGDNRKETIDSRFWGFLPEQNIVGKVQCVLWSNYKNEFQWSRFLKPIN